MSLPFLNSADILLVLQQKTDCFLLLLVLKCFAQITAFHLQPVFEAQESLKIIITSLFHTM